ncbi:MAG: glycosyltransferase family 4 protein [Elusimicrobia bacterium]|nr:glycosyltransferase family 4 protein [Elusimicrobiota bacterium]
MEYKGKILFVTDILFSDEQGGSGRVSEELGRELSDRGYEIHLFTPLRRPDLPEKEARGGINIYRFGKTGKSLNTGLSGIIAGIKRIKKDLENFEYDYIIFNHPYSAWPVYLSNLFKRCPKIYIFHSPWHEEYEIRAGKKGIGYWLRMWMEKKIVKNSDNIVVLSEFMKQKVMKTHKIDAARTSIVPGGIDTERFKPADDINLVRKSLSIPDKRIVLLTVRNLVPRMGLENLITAMRDIVNKHKNVILLIGGRGYLREKLQQQVDESGLAEYIKFLGYIDNELLPSYYQSADIFVLPTRVLEGFGLVTLEALASGTPVLGTPVGGTVEILKKFGSDFMFRDSTPGSMAELINKYIDNIPSEHNVLRKRCRDFINENYSWKIFASEIENVYSKIRNKY